MPAKSQPQSSDDETRALDAAVDAAITACRGDARAAVRALLVANRCYEAEYAKLVAQIPHGDSHARLPRDRKHWFDEPQGR